MLYQVGKVTDTIDYFTNLDSTYITDSAFSLSGLGPGHYIIASARQHQIEFKSWEIKYFDIRTYGYNMEAWIVVSDDEGNLVEDAEVGTASKSYPYRRDCGCYPIPAKESNGFFKIARGKEFSFINLNGYKPSAPRYKNKKNKYDNKNKLFSDVRILPGYVALNQPKYQLADTVKMKAFLVSEKGKPFKRKVKISVYDPNTSNKKKTKYGSLVFESEKLKPVTEGAYVYEFPIPDTLRIDRNYNLLFTTKRGQVLKTEEFRVEEYELGKVTYTAQMSKSKYYKGELPRIKMTARDVNGLPLLDAYAKIKVRASQMKYHHLDTFFMPHSHYRNLYEKEVMMDVSGETWFELPDSLFPWADINYYVNVDMNNSGNESKSFSLNFDYVANPEQYVLKIDGDSVKAKFLYLSEPGDPCKVEFRSYNGSELIGSKWVVLPYQEKLNYAATMYAYYDEQGKHLASVNAPSQIHKLVYVKGTRTHNKVSLELVNDVNVPISYQLFKDSKKIDGGRDTKFTYEATDESLDSYYLVYSFRWGQQDIVKEKGFHIREKELTVDVDQPEKIFPGAKVPITVSVTDYQTKEVSDVNITAWSVNMQFDEIPVPNLPYFGRTHFKILSPYNITYTNPTVKSNSEITHEYIALLDLYETPFYRFLYSKGGVDTEYDSIPRRMAEFTPYLYSNMALKKIFTVYLDNEPVYAYNGDETDPFSIVAKEGKYKLGIRTADAMYEIDQIELKKEMKAFICLHADSSYNNSKVKYVQLDSIPYMQVEEDRLNRQALLVNTSKLSAVYFEQDSVVHKVSYHRRKYYDPDHGDYNVLGPFKKGNINVTDVRNDTTYSFYFEPGYLYTFQKDTSWVSQPLLYPTPYNQIYGFNSTEDWQFNQYAQQAPIVGAKRRALEKKKREESIDKYTWEVKKQAHPLLKSRTPTGKYTTEYECKINLENTTGRSIQWGGFFSSTNDSCSHILFESVNRFSNMKPGIYDFVVFMRDSSILVWKDFQLKEQGKHYIRFDQSDLQPYNVELTNYYEEWIIRLNQPPLKKFRHPPLRIKGVEVTSNNSANGNTNISGYLQTEEGNPWDDAHIYAEIAGVFKAGAVTNTAGYFEIDSVPAGNYMLKIFSKGRYPYVVNDFRIVKGKDNHIVMEVDLPYMELVGGYGDHHLGMVSDEMMGASGASYSTLNSAYAAPLIERGEGAYRLTVSKEEIAKMPTRSPSMIASTVNGIPGIVGDDKDGRFGKDAIEALKNDEGSNRIRKNFRDYGFWMPNMVTGKDGKARFEVVFPDNLTKWKTIVPAMNGNKQTGIGFAETQSYKPLTASLGVPDFLVIGDSVQLQGKLLNYTEDKIDLKSYFKINGTVTNNKNHTVESVILDNYLFNPTVSGSQKITFGLDKGDGYIDGEERDLDIFHKGIKVSSSNLYELTGDTSIRISSKDGIVSRTLYVTNDPIDIIRKELEDLKRYNYGCNEQTSSKLKALLLEKKFMIDLNEAFREEQLLIKCLRKLERNQNDDGSWGWWDNGPADVWITTYVTEAMNMAASAGYRTRGHMKAAAYLKSQLDNMNSSDKLQTLNTLTSIPFPMDYGKYIREMQGREFSLQDELRYIRLCQRRDSTYSLNTVLESYESHPKGIYWGEDFLDVKVNKMQTSLLAYEILKEAGGQDSLLRKIRGFFMNYKIDEKNTIEQAAMLEQFLHDMLKESDLTESINGQVTINGKQLSANYPHTMDFTANETIEIEKKGAPVKVFTFDHWYENEPQGDDSLFTISTKFLVEGKEVTSLKAGEPVTLEVEVIAQKTSDYVLLEIPIPAGCSYGGKLPSTHRSESYREAFKHRTSIACAKLPRGRNKFYIELVPRFEGSFSLLPATVQLMYFPDVAGFTSTKVVNIVASR